MDLKLYLERLYYHHCPNQIPLTLSDDYLFYPHKVVANDGVTLSTFQFVPSQANPNLPVIIHFHGNYGDIAHHLKYVQPLIKAGFELWMWDYRGYGLTAGTPQHNLVLSDAVKVVDYCAHAPTRAARPLVLFGQSLGGHLAICVAAQHSAIQGLIFDCAFTSFIDIAKYRYPLLSCLAKRIVNQPYSAVEAIINLKIPTLALHAISDLSVPQKMGQVLYNRITHSHKEYWWYAGGHLHSYLHPEEYTYRVIEFIKKYGLLNAT